MSPAEMVEYGKNKKTESKLYARESSEAISEIVAQVADELTADIREHVSLGDTRRIKEILRRYLQSCVDTSTIPSISGYCRSLGISRTSFYTCLNSRTPAETAELFESVHDGFAEILNQCSLRGTVQPVVSIFLAKALFGYSDKTEVIVSSKADDPLGAMPDQAALEARLADIVVEDE